jgi:hypothetical protein
LVCILADFRRVGNECVPGDKSKDRNRHPVSDSPENQIPPDFDPDSGFLPPLE